jgi:hypothetical protein
MQSYSHSNQVVCGPSYYAYGPASSDSDSEDDDDEVEDGYEKGNNPLFWRSDYYDRGDRIPTMGALYDWEREKNGDEFTDEDMVQGYLSFYQHCSTSNNQSTTRAADEGIIPLRIDATWLYMDVPDIVRKVYDMIGDKIVAKKKEEEEQKLVGVQIFIVLPLFAIGQITQQDITTRNESNSYNKNDFTNCIGNVEDFYTYGLIDTKKSCKKLGSYWLELFPQQVHFIPCEFIQNNLTRFRLLWEEMLGLEGKKKEFKPLLPSAQLRDAILGSRQ